MGLRILPEMAQRSPEWYAARCGMVTASAVGQLLTPTGRFANNDKSRGLTAQLVAELITGEVEETPITPDMQRGIDHEPIALYYYAEHRSIKVEPCGFMVRTFTNDAGAEFRMGYSPDGLVGTEGLVEAKCPRAKSHVQTILADKVPDQYVPQLQAGLFVSGREWIDFVSFRAGLPLFIKRVTPDPEWQDAIAEAVALFNDAATEALAKWAAAIDGLPATEPIPDITDWSLAS